MRTNSKPHKMTEAEALEESLRMSTEATVRSQSQLESLKAHASTHGWRLIPIRGDGDCWAVALAFGATLLGQPMTHTDVRQATVNEIQRSFFDFIIPENLGNQASGNYDDSRKLEELAKLRKRYSYQSDTSNVGDLVVPAFASACGFRVDALRTDGSVEPVGGSLERYNADQIIRLARTTNPDHYHALVSLAFSGKEIGEALKFVKGDIPMMTRTRATTSLAPIPTTVSPDVVSTSPIPAPASPVSVPASPPVPRHRSQRKRKIDSDIDEDANEDAKEDIDEVACLRVRATRTAQATPWTKRLRSEKGRIFQMVSKELFQDLDCPMEVDIQEELGHQEDKETVRVMGGLQRQTDIYVKATIGVGKFPWSPVSAVAAFAKGKGYESFQGLACDSIGLFIAAWDLENHQGTRSLIRMLQLVPVVIKKLQQDRHFFARLVQWSQMFAGRDKENHFVTCYVPVTASEATSRKGYFPISRRKADSFDPGSIASYHFVSHVPGWTPLVSTS